jgi:O-antigen/teichoic acid export membrane protein
MKIEAVRPGAVSSRHVVVALVAGRVLLLGCSVVSIRLSTGLLGAGEMGTMNLLLSAINFFALLVGAFSLFFYRQVVEWQLASLLVENLGRYARFLVSAAAIACALMALTYLSDRSPWAHLSAPWLIVLLAGNLVMATLNGAVLHCLNVLGRRFSYVALSNLASWGGIGLAFLAVLLGGSRAEHWMAGLLCGQIVALALGAVVLRRRLCTSGPETIDPKPGAVAAFDIGTLWAFSWPLIICTGFYWVQRSSFAPAMAAEAGLQTLGLFSVGFSVGLLAMSSFDTLFREFYSPTYYHAIAVGTQVAKVTAWNDFAWACFPAMFAFALYVWASADFLLVLLTTSEFHGMGSVVRWGAASQLTISIYSLYMLLTASFHDNRVLLLPNVIGAGVVVLLLATLLPVDSMHGAGAAINAGLLATTLLVGWRLAVLGDVRLPFRRVALSVVVSTPLLVLPLAARLLLAGEPLTAPVAFGWLALGSAYMIFVQYRLAAPWLRSRD